MNTYVLWLELEKNGITRVLRSPSSTIIINENNWEEIKPQVICQNIT